jgi:hypothetical protein
VVSHAKLGLPHDLCTGHTIDPAQCVSRPPELITEGILTKAADVYAFGVITWEIYVGR